MSFNIDSYIDGQESENLSYIIRVMLTPILLIMFLDLVEKKMLEFDEHPKLEEKGL
jgi:hypothetical protein